MRRFGWMLLALGSLAFCQENGTIERFPFESWEITLGRPAQPFTPFDKTGRRFAVLGFESGTFEAWAYPLKLFRQFEFSFIIGNSTRPVRGRDIVRSIEAAPDRTTLTYTFQSFTVKAHFITPIRDPGAFILLEVAATEPLTIVCGFLPILQPMWPAGIGGQYAYWNEELKAYLISEPTRTHHGFVGSPAARGLSYTPAHMLSDEPNEFQIVVEDPASVRGRFIPILMAGGHGRREDVAAAYARLKDNIRSLYLETAVHYRNLLERTVRIETPDEEINKGFSWAKIAYDNLVVSNPDLGTGLVAGLAPSGTSGRPGFGWFFGGDTYINALSLNAYGDYQTAAEAIRFMVQFQRKDGKMAHEISQAARYIDWFGKYPYAYIHGDTSPFFIIAVHDYARLTGDLDFVRSLWPALEKAYSWSLATDEDGDGLMDNSKAGLGALEYGTLAGGIRTDIYVGAIWTRAVQAMADLSRWIGMGKFSKNASAQAEKALSSFRVRFWDEEAGVYAYAFNSQGEHVKEFSPWHAVGLMWDLGEPERSSLTLERLATSELTTDWGVRSISNRSAYFEPLNYNYGAVWPFLNSWVATAQFKNGFPHQGFSTLKATLHHVFENQLGAVGEVFSGSLHAWPQESVAHQGFSTAGTVLPLIRGLFGLDGDAVEKRITFSPKFPADWNRVALREFWVGASNWDFHVDRSDGRYRVDAEVDGGEGYTLDFRPVFGVGTRIDSMRVNGRSHPFEVNTGSPVILRSLVPVSESLRIEIFFQPAVEILPYVAIPRVGDENRGLKILSIKGEDGTVTVVCEGMAGQTYHLPVTRPERIRGVEGGRLEGSVLILTFPEGEWGSFVSKRIEILCDKQGN